MALGGVQSMTTILDTRVLQGVYEKVILYLQNIATERCISIQQYVSWFHTYFPLEGRKKKTTKSLLHVAAE